MKTKKFISDIQRRGAKLLRCSGSHWIFQIGVHSYVVPFSGSHLEVSQGTRTKVEKALRAAEAN